VKKLSIILMLLSLAGCMTTEQQKAQINAEDTAKCKSYGLNRGSQAYAQCRLSLDQTRASQEAQQREFYHQMTITGLNMMATPPAPPPRITTCTSNAWGQTTCVGN
jgi:hypothetical protein